MIDITTLDEHLQFVQREAVYLESRPESWAQQKAVRWKALEEFLRRIRRDAQMTGVGGKRIDD